MKPLTSVDDLYNFITTVVLCAPDRFPVRDYLAPGDQMTLEKAFEQLHQAIEMAYPQARFEQKRQQLAELLDASLASYRQNDAVRGASLLEDFRDAIFVRRA